MLSKTMEKAINEQINAEMYSAYLYLSMAAYFDDLNLSGFSNWMKTQFQEEQFHAQKFFDYVYARGGRVILEAIAKPESNWDSIKHVFEVTLKHEEHVTSLINNLVALAHKENDTATYNFLQWYVNEQVEEESNVDEVLKKLHLLGEQGPGIFMLDQQLATRVFTPPAPAGA